MARDQARWLDRMMAKGLAAQLAFEGGKSVGFIEYMPVELSKRHKGKGLPEPEGSRVSGG